MPTWLDEELIKQVAAGGVVVTPLRSILDFVAGEGISISGVDDPITRSTKITISTGALDFKQSVRAATAATLADNSRTGNVLTASFNGAMPAVDGVTLAAGDRVLVKNEAAGENNGIYEVTDAGSVSTPWILTRTEDADASSEVTSGLRVGVEEGSANNGKIYKLTTANPITLNTTALVFTLDGGGGGGGSLSAPADPADNGKIALASSGDLVYLGASFAGNILRWNGSTWGGQAITLTDPNTAAVGTANAVLWSNGTANSWATAPTLAAVVFAGSASAIQLTDTTRQQIEKRSVVMIGFYDDSATVRNIGLFANDAPGSAWKSGDRVVFLANRTASPTASPNTGGVFLYSSSDTFVAAGLGGFRAIVGTTTVAELTGTSGDFLSLGANVPTSGIARIANGGIFNWRNAANNANLAVLELNSSNNIIVGNDTSTVTDLRAASNVRTFAGGVQSSQLGRSSGDFIRMGGTNYASTGLLRVTHGSVVIAGRNNAGSADRTIVDWGSTTDTAQFGDDAANTTLRGLAITIGNATGVIQYNSSSTGHQMQVSGTSRFTVGSSSVSMNVTSTTFAASVVNPTFGQATESFTTAVGDTLTVTAQDCSGTGGTTGGALVLKGGNATGASGTRNGGKATLAGGTGADSDGAVALAVKGADALTLVPAATPYIELTSHETATTVGAAGGASALPATPTGYLRMGLGGGGTRIKVPYYAD